MITVGRGGVSLRTKRLSKIPQAQVSRSQRGCNEVGHWRMRRKERETSRISNHFHFSAFSRFFRHF